MYLAPGTADQRLRFYRRVDAGADGFIRPVYQFVVERWGRVDDLSERAQVPLSPQAHVEHRTDAVATIAEGIPVDLNGLVKWQDTLYFVRGTITIRQLRCQRLNLEAVNPTAYATFDLIENANVLDGLNLQDAAVGTYLLLEDGEFLLLENSWRILLEASGRGFSSGFSSGFA
jgi:hypothetical protein